MIAKCPKCNNRGKLDSKLAGKQIRCPRCGNSFVAGDDQRRKWFYADGENKVGPFEQEDFDRLVTEGAISSNTLVWSKGMDSWKPISEVVRTSPSPKWYYADGNNKVGPLNQEQFDLLVADGTIGAKTLVWHKGMGGWRPFAEARMPEAEVGKCGSCGKDFETGKLTDQGGIGFCETCSAKALLIGRRKRSECGGFLNRSIAKIIDLLFMLAMAGMVEGLSRKLFPGSYSGDTLTPVFIVTLTINMLIGIFYITWFVGKFGATPGKMVVNLKITNYSGGKIGYLRAFGRYCGEYIACLGIIVGLFPLTLWALNNFQLTDSTPMGIVVAVIVTLSLVYGPAFLDRQRRTLYDRLCNTRVVVA